ncbi:MAG: hypothetical protein R3F21_11150 [Myxococcota bacterium]
MRDRPKVGEILVQAGIIDELQLASALGEQTRWGRRLGMTLIKLGMVQEGQLVRALAKQFDLPVASLSGKKIAPEVIALVPAKVACDHSVIPLFVKKDGPKAQLFLGMEEPSDLGVLDDLAFRTGMLIRPVMVGPSEIGEAIDRYYTTKSVPAAPASSEPARLGDTLSETNLRRIREETPPPAPRAAPIPTSIEAPPLTLIPSNESVFAPIPAPEAIEEITAPVQPSAAAAPAMAPTQAIQPPAPQPAATPPAAAPATSPEPIAEQTSAPIAAPASAPAVSPAADSLAANDGLAAERAHLLEETERTRLVAKAIAHLLIEKGILTFEELQARIEKMKAKPSGPDSPV